MGSCLQETGVRTCFWEGWVREVSLEKTYLREEGELGEGLRWCFREGGLLMAFFSYSASRFLSSLTSGSFTFPVLLTVSQNVTAPHAVQEAEQKCRVPEAQASFWDLWGPSFLASWIPSPLCCLTPYLKKDWKTPPGLPSILC